MTTTKKTQTKFGEFSCFENSQYNLHCDGYIGQYAVTITRKDYWAISCRDRELNISQEKLYIALSSFDEVVEAGKGVILDKLNEQAEELKEKLQELKSKITSIENL
jgi:hypothetical protein